MDKNEQSRKWLLTFNNPLEHGYTHERIKEILSEMETLLYWCMADEKGTTHHTHLYIHAKNPRRLSAMLKKFPGVHHDKCRGTAQDNYDYITKTGKHENTDKAETRIEGTFEEWGELPDEHQGQRTDFLQLREDIRNGMSNMDLIEKNPENMFHLSTIDNVRKTMMWDRFRKEEREVEVIYLYGETGVGKTSMVRDRYGGWDNIHKVTDYNHPFEGYEIQDVLLLDEYEHSLKITDMNNYLDRYPLLLPARYTKRVACFTKVCIVSNLPLKDQYPIVQLEKPSIWRAFLRRINKCYKMDKFGLHEIDIETHTGIKLKETATPDWVAEAEKQIEMECGVNMKPPTYPD